MHGPLSSYGLPEIQAPKDLNALVGFAAEAGVRKIIGKPLKVPVSREGQRGKDLFGNLLTDTHLGRVRTLRGGTWRFPKEYQDAMLERMACIAAEHGMTFSHCLRDVLER